VTTFDVASGTKRVRDRNCFTSPALWGDSELDSDDAIYRMNMKCGKSEKIMLHVYVLAPEINLMYV